MNSQWNVSLFALIIVLFCLILIIKCRKLDGYKFAVYSTEFCPRNETEWNKRSSLFNCTGEDSTYACFPNDDITELIEFCYPLQIIAIPPGLCLFLSKARSEMEAYDCNSFEYGCPRSHYRGSTIFKNPSCVSIGNGCFIADPFCERSLSTLKTKGITTAETRSTTFSDNSSIQHTTSTNIWIGIAIFFGVSTGCTTGCIIFIVFRRKRITCRRQVDEEDPNFNEFKVLLHDQNEVNDNWNKELHNSNDGNITANSTDEELQSVLTFDEDECAMDCSMKIESQYEKDLFEDWQNEDKMFVPTKACKEVGKMIKHKQLVIVAGHSGCGKTAIVQHIALRYRSHGWLVKPVDKVQEIKDSYVSHDYIKDKTIFVFNDPIGKESLTEVLHTEWKEYEQTLTRFLTSVKIVLSCRKCIVFDTRVKGLFEDRSNIVVIDDNQNKLSDSEKSQILKKYAYSEDISEETTKLILKVETYFPLLCKLFASSWKYSTDQLRFFTEPTEFIKNEIKIYKESDRVKYCGLVCLVLFNNKVEKEDLIEREDLFKKCLNLCGIQEYLPPATIIQNLDLLEGFFVKKICNTYKFYHDFVLEVTTFVFGKDYPREMVKHADIGFLQRRVRMENRTKPTDQFTITLSDRHINDLVDRLSEDICKDRFMEVVLNPCLRNERIADLFIERMKNKSLQMIVKQTKLNSAKSEVNFLSKENWFSRLDFLFCFEEVSPLFALIIFRHEKLARFFLNRLSKCFSTDEYFPAICCNGSKDLYNMYPKRKVKSILKESQFILHPIHIVTVFHNYELLNELIKRGVDVNMALNKEHTPLTLAIANKTEQFWGKSNFSSQEETVRILLSNGALINMCIKGRQSPLYIACQNGSDSTIHILLNNGAEINLCTKKGSGPLSIACENGHKSTVEILLNNGAKVNQCDKEGFSPLCIACHKGNETTVQLLLNHGADVNLCNENGLSPLYISSKNGHDNTVEILLKNGAEINLCSKERLGPLYTACKYGHDSTVEILLKNGAEVNQCDKEGISPLCIACHNGHDSTVMLLLNNDANVNLCNENGLSPLYISCKKGLESTVEILLKNGAKVNQCDKEGISPLYIACKKGNDSNVKNLIKNGAEICLCSKEGFSPLYTACKNGHDSTVGILLKNGAEVNQCDKKGFSPLYIACKKGNDSTVKILLENGAQINLCSNEGLGPLYTACKKGHDSTVEILLKNGAEVHQCDNEGFSPLCIACHKGHYNTVQLLLNNGADVNLCYKEGLSPLYVACQNGNDSIAQLLLNNGSDVNLCYKKGFSPLHIACHKGHDSTVQLLLNHSVDVNVCNKEGLSPLYIAYQSRHDSIVQLLLNNGAEVNSCDNEGIGRLCKST